MCHPVWLLKISQFYRTPVRLRPRISQQLIPKQSVQILKKKLTDFGLIDINSSRISHSTQQELVQLLVSYNDIFSKHALDCGEAKGFSHRIRLIDERPFRLPYRRVPPAHYQKLRQALTKMEDQSIIRKSSSEFASPLVMVWKKTAV